MLIGYVISGSILILIGLFFVVRRLGGRTIARLIPLGFLGKLFEQFIVSMSTGAFFILIGTWLLWYGL